LLAPTFGDQHVCLSIIALLTTVASSEIRKVAAGSRAASRRDVRTPTAVLWHRRIVDPVVHFVRYGFLGTTPLVFIPFLLGGVVLMCLLLVLLLPLAQ